MRCTITPTY